MRAHTGRRVTIEGVFRRRKDCTELWTSDFSVCADDAQNRMAFDRSNEGRFRVTGMLEFGSERHYYRDPNLDRAPEEVLVQARGGEGWVPESYVLHVSASEILDTESR